ncbi:hypothetical protein BRC93_12015 [Halobacteriales archaeon QS_5_70_15]|nr:MAG: hypothetical protein BRC93_12015 [Halobacteriales archaeon QS_5_70_15]
MTSDDGPAGGLPAVDHAVVAGSDLDALGTAFADVGLETEYGGEHSNGVTHNRTLGFADGSYLELISTIEPGPRPSASRTSGSPSTGPATTRASGPTGSPSSGTSPRSANGSGRRSRSSWPTGPPASTGPPRRGASPARASPASRRWWSACRGSTGQSSGSGRSSGPTRRNGRATRGSVPNWPGSGTRQRPSPNRSRTARGSPTGSTASARSRVRTCSGATTPGGPPRRSPSTTRRGGSAARSGGSTSTSPAGSGSWGSRPYAQSTWIRSVPRRTRTRNSVTSEWGSAQGSTPAAATFVGTPASATGTTTQRRLVSASARASAGNRRRVSEAFAATRYLAVPVRFGARTPTTRPAASRAFRLDGSAA